MRLAKTVRVVDTGDLHAQNRAVARSGGSVETRLRTAERAVILHMEAVDEHAH